MGEDPGTDMERALKVQRNAHYAGPPELIDARKDRIRPAIGLLKNNADELNRRFRRSQPGAVDDHGPRGGTVSFGKYCLKNIDKWARSEKRHVHSRSAC